MPEPLIYYVGNRNPSIFENITTDGEAFDLSSSTVRFKMRAVGTSTLTVDAAATIVPPATDGIVRYDWASADVDTAGHYLVWWEVTTGGKIQDVQEAIIELRSHGPDTNVYVELEMFKSTADLQHTNYLDADIRSVLAAASRAVDEICCRRFYADTDATQIRYYTPHRPDHLYIDDLITLTTLKTDEGRDGTFENTWTANSDFWAEPLNAAADSKPYTAFRVNPDGNQQFFPGYVKSVQVTGKFGWSAVPENVKAATTILAGRFLKRTREAPFGAAEMLALGGAAIRLSGKDPDVSSLLGPYIRHPYTY